MIDRRLRMLLPPIIKPRRNSGKRKIGGEDGKIVCATKGYSDGDLIGKSNIGGEDSKIVCATEANSDEDLIGKSNIGGEDSEIIGATEADSDGDFIMFDDSSNFRRVTDFIDQIARRVEKLEVQQYKIQRRALIQKGRFFYWNMYGEEYLKKFSDNIYIPSHEIDGCGGFYTVPYPSIWNHFITIFLRTRETEVGFLDVLMEKDTYDDLSLADLDIDARTAANMVLSLNEDKLKELFEVVFGDLEKFHD